MLKVPKNAQKYILRSFYAYAADKFLNLMENIIVVYQKTATYTL